MPRSLSGRHRGRSGFAGRLGVAGLSIVTLPRSGRRAGDGLRSAGFRGVRDGVDQRQKRCRSPERRADDRKALGCERHRRERERVGIENRSHDQRRRRSVRSSRILTGRSLIPCTARSLGLGMLSSTGPRTKRADVRPSRVKRKPSSDIELTSFIDLARRMTIPTDDTIRPFTDLGIRMHPKRNHLGYACTTSPMTNGEPPRLPGRSCRPRNNAAATDTC